MLAEPDNCPLLGGHNRGRTRWTFLVHFKSRTRWRRCGGSQRGTVSRYCDNVDVGQRKSRARNNVNYNLCRRNRPEVNRHLSRVIAFRAQNLSRRLKVRVGTTSKPGERCRWPVRMTEKTQILPQLRVEFIIFNAPDRGVISHPVRRFDDKFGDICVASEQRASTQLVFNCVWRGLPRGHLAG